MAHGEWGKYYASDALIKTSGSGSFDDNALSGIKDLRPARQINYSEGYTDDLKRSLCKNFFMCGYIDADGNECLVNLEKIEAGGTLPTVTFGDILQAKSTITVREPDTKNIFCNPFVSYNINPSTGEYQSIIQIKNASSNVYDSSYVVGWSGGDAQDYWERCHELWLKSHHIEKPPSELTDLKWANGDNINAAEIAEWYIKKWIDYMSHRSISFSVHYLHGNNSVNTRDWFPGQHFYVQLLHETDNVQIECIAEKININLQSPFNIDVDAIMLDDVPKTVTIQDVWYTEAEGAHGDAQDVWSGEDKIVHDRW